MEASTMEKLVRASQTGDQEAFALLYDEFATKIYKFITFKISDTEQAEDLLQEVFIKAWRGCGSLDLHNLNFSAWLYTIAGNTVNDYFRKVYRRPQTVSLNEEIDIIATDDTSTQADNSINSDIVQKALSNLPTNYKQVLELRFIENFSVEETATILKKSNVTVRVLQYRALKKLEGLFKHKI